MNREHLIDLISKTEAPQIVALIPMNNQANPAQIIEQLRGTFQAFNITLPSFNEANKQSFSFPYFMFSVDNKAFPQLQRKNYIFIICPREIELTLDICKVADIICPILSCRECNFEKMALDPYE